MPPMWLLIPVALIVLAVMAFRAVAVRVHGLEPAEEGEGWREDPDSVGRLVRQPVSPAVTPEIIPRRRVH
jgi:hypothetical protein